MLFPGFSRFPPDSMFLLTGFISFPQSRDGFSSDVDWLKGGLGDFPIASLELVLDVLVPSSSDHTQPRGFFPPPPFFFFLFAP